MLENTIETPAMLRAAVGEVFDEHRDRSEESLESARKVQALFAASYKSRFFLELLQNARDAIIAGRVKNGSIKAWLENDCLYFANNGIPFDRKGVRSLCFPAISTKDSRDFIGHKGIGFSAVLEITDSPEVITNYGTIVFNTAAAAIELGNKHLPSELPLFQYPMYREENITAAYPVLATQGFTTIFRFPLKDAFKGKTSLVAANLLAPEDLVFLKAIQFLQIGDSDLTLNDEHNPVTVSTGGSKRNFKSYDTILELPPADIARFSPEELESFGDATSAECRYLLEIGEDGKFKPTPRARLHLFYGMDFGTGLSFSIHSLFAVTLDRKRLATDSYLNQTLFKQIAAFYSGTFLEKIKAEFARQELEILAFTRESNNQLDKFYDHLRAGLRTSSFIYHEPSNAYKSPSEIYLVSQAEYEVFRDGFLGEKCLFKAPSERIKSWLQKECGVVDLPDSSIKHHIEAKCLQFVDDPAFFTSLYELLNSRKLTVTDKQVLLTQNNTLVKSNETEIYYQRRSNLKSPAILDASVSFLNNEIKIDRIREEARKYLGVREFNEQNLINTAIKVLKVQNPIIAEDQKIIVELLYFLKQFESIDDTACQSITESIHLPTQNRKTENLSWRSPLYSPVYFDDFLYGSFYNQDFDAIDWTALGITNDVESWRSFLARLGVWTIPAIYIVEGETTFEDNDSHTIITNDRALHQPYYLSAEFAIAWCNAWPTYRLFIITNRYNAKMAVDGQSYDDKKKTRSSAAYRLLQQLAWIPAKQAGQPETLHRAKEVIYLTQDEKIKTANQVISAYYPVGELDNVLHAQFIEDFDLKHLNIKSAQNFYNLLDHVAATDLNSISDLRNYEKCYHRFLAYLSDFYNAHRQHVSLPELKKRKYLCRSLIDQSYDWELGENCIHIDEKALLDKLSANGLLRYIDNPFSFTKRDKNEWGKHAKDIGRPISSIFALSLGSTGNVQSLISTVKNLELVIAFVEADLDNNFTDVDIQYFKTAELYIHQQLLVNYHYVAGDKTIELRQLFYTTGDKDKARLNIETNVQYRSRQLSEALLDYFEHYTGRELKRLNLVFEQLLDPVRKGESKRRYAADLDIDLVRVEQIQNLLTEDYYVDKPRDEGGTIIVVPVPTNPNLHPAFKPVSKVVHQEVEQIELETEFTLAESLEYLDQFTSLPSELFTPAVDTATSPVFTAPVTRRPATNHTMPIPRAELSEDARKDIGLMAEYYVYKKLIEAEPSLLELLGLDASVAKSVCWFNLPRIADQSIDDQSVGIGHDLYLDSHDLAIEVKGMVDNTPYVHITGPEFDSMRRRGDKYFLIIIKKVIKGDQIKTLVIRDPYREIVDRNLKFIEAKVSGTV
ncbi:sacsin N-terminal ATP-binding-like domain-containing protein [Arcticibacter pallidicorallinus]|nr:DUF3883 domain-containing protein [Arcticibacter pallidicorallinus]